MAEPQQLQHECPMCGELMRLKHHTRIVKLSGLPEKKAVEVAEWECPECDYFEEYEPPGPGTGDG